MGGLGGHLVRGIVGLSVPTLAVVALGVYFLVDKVPDFERAERRRVLGEYRQQVVDFRSSGRPGTPVVRGKGSDWERAGKMAPGFWGVYLKEPFDVEGLAAGSRFPAGAVPLWYDDGKGHVVAWWGERVEETDVAAFLRFVVPLFLLVLVFVTVFGVRVFVRYAKERDDFVAATAHDLTTPLVALRRLIGRDDAEAKAVAERMVRLVKNLTEFLRLGGKRPSPEMKTVDIRKAYDEAYALFREDYRWLFGGKDVAAEGPETLMAEADATMCVQVLWNLLANDLKYAAPYGPVSVRFEEDGAVVRVSFADGGKGLTANERKRIFDRYYRAKSVMKSGKGGFGIGLCTAREFARAMGGDLTVAANEPTGCVFTLTLRRAK